MDTVTTKLLAILAITAFLSWWLSKYDAAVTGEDQRADFKRRAVRCGATLLLVGAGFGAILGRGREGGFVFIGILVPLAIIWAGCLSEIFARCFHCLIDPQDSHAVESGKLAIELDNLARQVQEGRYEEAVMASAAILKTGEVGGLAMEAVLFRLYGEMLDESRLSASTPLAEACQLCQSGRCTEAASALRPLVEREPKNLAAAMLLMRIYTRDLARPDKAEALVQTIGRRNDAPPGFADYARRSIREWSGAVAPAEKGGHGIESLLSRTQPAGDLHPVTEVPGTSIDELLKKGQLGTAIETLEREANLQPNNFEVWLKLAEAYGHHCCNLRRARSIVAEMERNTAFSPAQVQRAKSKLREWQISLETGVP